MLEKRREGENDNNLLDILNKVVNSKWTTHLLINSSCKVNTLIFRGDFKWDEINSN